MKRIKTYSGKAKKNRLMYKGHIPLSSLEKIEVGSKLRGLSACYHIGKFHPDVISTINLVGISEFGKRQVIDWIHAGKIYIKKDE